jgi:hypothetical protein
MQYSGPPRFAHGGAWLKINGWIGTQLCPSTDEVTGWKNAIFLMNGLNSEPTP